MPEHIVQKRAFSIDEAAHYTALSVSYLRQARMTGSNAPKYDAPQHTVITNRKIVYLREDLDAWLDEKKLSQTASKEASA